MFFNPTLQGGKSGVSYVARPYCANCWIKYADKCLVGSNGY